ncbi:class I SAM-dependent methyltransferase [Myceligenerans pegani]|uniref:Class I SAM-dependent methyltransferase n=1 Tax=Myceligenerans pegani TaxID=2776917 RepID=A0ABR9N6T9_9MICO|nr:class I SAM-dependent methyltransferase [Myceligenerans sp. TRM 65318]MBE1878889.1 class I SAM-dependent methyltransferase [Myceligenerans sp. TRM 65318]MBE3021160.1 class I SAM-dependent methyltransferase [Myceligenerans sp. TRM 65318]
MSPVRDYGYRDVPDDEGGAASRGWWDTNAGEYLDDHDAFLAGELHWGPEGLTESEAGLLGDVAGRDVLEIGAGAAQCSRWLAGRGARVLATDVSWSMLHEGRERAASGRPDGAPDVVPLVQADARRLPFADASFDVVFTSFGAIPFVPDAARVHTEAARVLRPGGRWVLSVTHPLRWAFPDDPTAHGLTATRSYFDRRPYVETDDAGRVAYAEYHRTVGDHVREIASAGLRLVDLVEPEWPAWNTQTWGGWGPERGHYLPGTAIFVADKT